MRCTAGHATTVLISTDASRVLFTHIPYSFIRSTPPIKYVRKTGAISRIEWFRGVRLSAAQSSGWQAPRPAWEQFRGWSAKQVSDQDRANYKTKNHQDAGDSI
jgi:hypothetical protein